MNIIIDLFTYEIVGFVLDWMEKGMKSDAEGMLKRACYLFEGIVVSAFKRSEED